MDMAINAEWHARHPMPTRATMQQRAKWHIEHAKQCACRPIPATVESYLRREPPPNRKPSRRTG